MAYQIMFYGGLAGALICITLAILAYVRLNIAQVLTDLTGRNFPGAGRKARKRSKAEDTVTKPITKEIHVRKNVEKEVAVGEYVEPTEKMASGPVASTALLNHDSVAPTALLSQESFKQTAFLNEGELDPTALLNDGGQTAESLRQAAASAARQLSGTTLLADAPTETTILSDWNETTVLTADADETTLLDDMDETTLLTEEEPRFQKQVDIMIVHSNTII
ncbi:hypothetical protein [Mesobacillus subterraneus]|uniref:Uncharacterized protein n=1 Tax=Mesobacillus subterraneus TaxID=285983 RepID=A0A3R9E694_9BACI|nr:hypothetical protein [Mesobacillus subterraneus]RSD27087.1 hypothetical protein EJA10_11120 [Mesobacillus subterraneus]